MKRLWRIIVYGIQAFVAFAILGALLLPKRDQASSTPTVAPTITTEVINKSGPPTATPWILPDSEEVVVTPRIVIPTVVDTPESAQPIVSVIPTAEPTLLAMVATPRKLNANLIVNAKLVIGKSLGSVERVMGKPDYIDTGGMDEGWELRTYIVDGYNIDVTINDSRIATDLSILLFQSEGFTRADYNILWQRFGLTNVPFPDKEFGESEGNAAWTDVEGLKLDVGIANNLVEYVEIAQPEE